MAAVEKNPITPEGAQKLRDELHHRKTTERNLVSKMIGVAREHGDLKENAEYHAAREQQSFAEGRIAEIESKLSLAQVVDVTKVPASGKVIFGTTVELADVDTGDELKYQIVGEDEADSKQGLISYSSPIARALIGKSEGDVAQVQAPAGIRELEIIKVHYI
jgi:transcription elongation factor GreA